ncbi:MAG: sugar transferase, partial [Abditibacteriota bacterium]|nr:sugar transferase [Abditibacteriota bacterium]
PVIFKQRRVGKNGREFDFYKFRSMAVNNDDSRHKEYIKHFIDGNEEELKRIQGEAEIYKLADDNRVTPIGKFLRKTSLDELPQLINVLRGDMSMVGPRPHLPYEVEMYKPWHRRRLSGTPGITGIWQLYGRSKVPFDESVSMDIWYLEHQSLKLDLEIIFRTFVKIFGDEGAC